MDKIPVALIYDFDGTLAPGNMQEHLFIPSLETTKDSFWEEVARIAKENNVDHILAYMYLMLRTTAERNIQITKGMLRDYVKDFPLFPGVTTWFDTINTYRDDIAVQHYIVSSGLREMVRGLPIAHHFTEVFACDFIYQQDVAVAAGVAVNYTNKTQFLFRINKNTHAVSDTTIINAVVAPEDRPIPFSHMIYIGDGPTDIPCFTVIRQNGGYGIAVYNPDQEETKKVTEQLLRDNRVDCIAPADYRENSQLLRAVQQMFDTICANYAVQTLSENIE